MAIMFDNQKGNPFGIKAVKKRFDFVLLIDKSGSTKDIIEKIQLAMRIIVKSLTNTPYLCGVDAYFTLVLFDGNHEKVIDTVLVINVNDAVREGKVAGLQGVDISAQKWQAGGCTDTGKALVYAINEYYYGRYTQWKQEGVERYHPYFCLLSDGYPDGGIIPNITEEEKKRRQDEVDKNYATAANMIKQLENSGKIVFSAISVDNSDNVAKLKELTNYPERVIHLDTTKSDSPEFEATLDNLIGHTLSNVVTPLGEQFNEL